MGKQDKVICQQSPSKYLKLFQLSVIVMIVFTFLKAIFPEEIKALGNVGMPLEEIGVPAPKDKVLFVLVDGLSERFTNSLGPPVEGSVFGRFTIF